MALTGEKNPIGNILSQKTDKKKTLAEFKIVLNADQSIELEGIETIDETALSYMVNEAKFQIDAFRMSIIIAEQFGSAFDGESQ